MAVALLTLFIALLAQRPRAAAGALGYGFPPMEYTASCSPDARFSQFRLDEIVATIFADDHCGQILSSAILCHLLPSSAPHIWHCSTPFLDVQFAVPDAISAQHLLFLSQNGHLCHGTMQILDNNLVNFFAPAATGPLRQSIQQHFYNGLLLPLRAIAAGSLRRLSVGVGLIWERLLMSGKLRSLSPLSVGATLIGLDQQPPLTSPGMPRSPPCSSASA